VLGHQVGGGTGNTVATIAGAAGGAVAGNAIEKNRAGSDSSYRISVRMNDGSRETYDQEANPDMLRAGDLARIENGRVYRR
jgi:outer membrane lipoprotein SlyB